MIRVLLLEEEPEVIHKIILTNSSKLEYVKYNMYLLLDPSDEDAALSDTQTTESSTSVVVPLVQALLVMSSVLSDESFRRKLNCVDVTVKLLMLLPAIFL